MILLVVFLFLPSCISILSMKQDESEHCKEVTEYREDAIGFLTTISEKVCSRKYVSSRGK